MIATGPEALTVAKRILDTHIGDAFNGLTITPAGGVTILVADITALARAGAGLHLRHVSSFVPTWTGTVDDIHVSLRLEVPIGILPARTRQSGAVA